MRNTLEVSHRFWTSWFGKANSSKIYCDIFKIYLEFTTKMVVQTQNLCKQPPILAFQPPSLKSIRSKMSFVTATVCISRAVRSFEKWFAKRSFGSFCWKVSEEVGRGCEIFFGGIFREKKNGGAKEKLREKRGDGWLYNKELGRWQSKKQRRYDEMVTN